MHYSPSAGVFVRSGPPQISSEEGTYNSFHEATNALLTGTGKAQNMELRPTTSNAAAWVLVSHRQQETYNKH